MMGEEREGMDDESKGVVGRQSFMKGWVSLCIDWDCGWVLILVLAANDIGRESDSSLEGSSLI